MSVAIASFMAFATAQVGTPGPANMALMTTGARYGLRRALPFVAGVALGKQAVIWPMGFGLLAVSEAYPGVFELLKWISAGYICWLAWKVANLRLRPGQGVGAAPGFWAGFIVHPLNPKAWGMITVGFTSFVDAGTPALQATLTIAICLLSAQVVLHPLYTFAGARLAQTVAGKPVEKYLMWTLAALTVASVFYVILGGTTT